MRFDLSDDAKAAGAGRALVLRIASVLRWHQGQALRMLRTAGRGRALTGAGSGGMTASLPHQENSGADERETD
jgi:hypothetical protein